MHDAPGIRSLSRLRQVEAALPPRLAAGCFHRPVGAPDADDDDRGADEPVDVDEEDGKRDVGSEEKRGDDRDDQDRPGQPAWSHFQGPLNPPLTQAEGTCLSHLRKG